MKIEIEFDCKNDANNRVSFACTTKSDLITIETYRGNQNHMIQISVEDLKKAASIIYNL